MPNTNAKPPKKRKAFGRNKRGGNKKQSSYDFQSAREAMALPTANHAQIIQHAIIQRATEIGETPPNQKSPLKAVYKSMLKQKLGEVESLRSQNIKLKSGIDHKIDKISKQSQTIRELASLLQVEKRKSRAIIENLMMEQSDSVIAEAHDISVESDAKVSAVCHTLDRSEQRYKKKLHKERQHNFNQVESCKFVSLPCFHTQTYFTLTFGQSPLLPVTRNPVTRNPISKIKA